MPKNLFDYEKKKMDALQENNDFLQSFIQDFQGKKGVSNEILGKYEKILGTKTVKKEQPPPPKIIFEDIIEKTIASEQDFSKNRQCFEAVEKDER